MLHMLPLDLLSNKFQSYLNYLIHQTTPHRPPAPVQIPTVCVPPEMGAGVQWEARKPTPSATVKIHSHAEIYPVPCMWDEVIIWILNLSWALLPRTSRLCTEADTGGGLGRPGLPATPGVRVEVIVGHQERDRPESHASWRNEIRQDSLTPVTVREETRDLN